MDQLEIDEVLIENRRMRKALEFIESWKLPTVSDFGDKVCSYESAYGSNGARDFIKNVAKEALAK